MANIYRSGYVSIDEVARVLKAATNDGWTIVRMDPKFATGDKDTYFIILHRDTEPPPPATRLIIKESGFLRTRRERDDAPV